MQFRSVLLISALFFSSSYVASAAPQINFNRGIGGDITSIGGSIASDATSVAGSIGDDLTGIFETVTSVGGSLVTIVTSAGGKAFTVASSEATAIAGDITSFFEGATATATQSTAAHSNAASRMAMGGLSTPLYTSGLTVLAGIFLGAWAIL